jgi:Fe-S-cluster-containing dehydrogenase component
MSNNKAKLVKRLIVDVNKCTGCMACTLVCSFTKFGLFGPEYSRIRVLKFEEAGVDCPILCQQCEEARCMEACPKEAIIWDARTGIIVIDEEICDGCGICMVACPYGAISVHPEPSKKKRLVLKCDLCGGNPQCLAWCETGALQYVDVDETQLIKEARENLVMAKKRFEIEHHIPLWKYYNRRSRVASVPSKEIQ